MSSVKTSSKRLKISGKRKAAILIRLLGNTLASKVISLLGKKEREFLRYALKTESNIKKFEEIEILREFIAEMNYYRSLRRANLELYFKILMFLIVVLFVLGVLVFQNIFYELQRFLVELNKFFAIGGGYLLIIPFLALYIKNKTGKGIFNYGFKSPNLLRDVLTGIVTSVFIFILLSLINLNISYESEIKGFYREIYVLVLLVLAPFSEETLFRGIIYDLIEKKYNKHLALFGTSLIFALAHLPKDATEFFLYFIISLILGMLRYANSNLIASFIAHSIGNLGIYLFK